ncbi:MAG: hypothetical protein IPI16_18065 [Comamonadaceae bacterium]|nr:hypothetical protein [Comamonadaceae bacterium]
MAFNATTDSRPRADWLVWAHQDVFLPEGWDRRFAAALRDARFRFPNLAVAGAYGISGAGRSAVRAGHVLDRGQLLKEPAALPCPVNSLDELLLAVRVDSPLRMDPALGFDFYATDLVLQAQEAGLASAVVDAYCEHWSDTPSSGPMPRELFERVKANGHAFEVEMGAPPAREHSLFSKSPGPGDGCLCRFDRWVAPEIILWSPNPAS